MNEFTLNSIKVLLTKYELFTRNRIFNICMKVNRKEK